MRISGSPPLRSSDASACSSALSLCESTRRPVTSRPHAAALTNSDGLRPTCARQSPRLELVADQPVARRGIRNAQQRFGEAHERDAFARIERELEHQRVDAARLAAFRAHAFREAPRDVLRGLQRRRRHLRLGQERRDGGRFVAAVVARDARPQRLEARRGEFCVRRKVRIAHKQKDHDTVNE